MLVFVYLLILSWIHKGVAAVHCHEIRRHEAPDDGLAQDDGVVGVARDEHQHKDHLAHQLDDAGKQRQHLLPKALQGVPGAQQHPQHRVERRVPHQIPCAVFQHEGRGGTGDQLHQLPGKKLHQHHLCRHDDHRAQVHGAHPFAHPLRLGTLHVRPSLFINTMPDTLIVLIGPTGVGKTELSLSIAEHFRTSIVSADSRQLYADLKIGTAAPTPEQLARVPHYFVGTLQLTDYYSAAQYEADVLAQLEILYQNHDTVILTGGSMMYIDAICKGIDDIPTVDNETRQLMLRRYEQEGLDTLCAELRLLDPEYYKIVDLKNPKRVIHALEICYMTGKTYTSFRTRTHKERPFHIIKIGLTRDREELYDRINRRVDIMMQDGLLEEARQVYPFRHLNSLNTVGYKEMFKYLDGEWTLEFAIGKIKQNSRIYSRKQMTWFKRDKDIVWFHPDQQTEIMQYIHSVNH